MAIRARARPATQRSTGSRSLELSDVPPSDPMETIRKGMRLLSPKTGILRDIGTAVQFQGDPVCYVVGNKSCETSHFARQVKLKDRSGSAGLTLERALAAAIGEAVERYCMRFFHDDELILGTYEDLSKRYNVVDPRLARLHSREQIETKGASAIPGSGGRRTVFTEESNVRWTVGHSLNTGEPILVPAFLTYLPYKAEDGEDRPGWNSSTGLAAGNTLEEAIHSGICEWVERDAFVISWLNRFMPRRLEVDDPDLRRMLRDQFHVDHPQVNLRIFDTTLDIGIPSAFAWMVRPMDFGTGVFVGAACRPEPRGAVTKALLELAQCVPYARVNLKRHVNWEPRDDFTDVKTFQHHSIFYMKRPDLLDDAFRFCREVPRSRKLSEMPDMSTGSVRGDIDSMVEELGRHGYEVIVVDLTTSDVREVGLHAVRVVIPGLQNLHGNHNWPCLGVERVFEVPQALGLQTQAWDPSAGVNPYPHPFP